VLKRALALHRSNLADRNARDRDDEIEAAGHASPSEAFLQTLELSELVRQLARATGTVPPDDLAAKAQLYAWPLRVLLGKTRDE
jgi:hypothetical protein